GAHASPARREGHPRREPVSREVRRQDVRLGGGRDMVGRLGRRLRGLVSQRGRLVRGRRRVADGRRRPAVGAQTGGSSAQPDRRRGGGGARSQGGGEHQADQRGGGSADQGGSLLLPGTISNGSDTNRLKAGCHWAGAAATSVAREEGGGPTA